MKTLKTIILVSFFSIIVLNQTFVKAQSWVKQTTNTTNILWGIDFPTVNVGYAVGLNGIIIKTTDGGTNWSSVTSITTQFLQDVHFFNADTGVICGYAGFYSKTWDGGVNWTDRIDPGTTNKLLRFFFLSDMYGFMVGEGGIIRKTIDGGDNWISVTSPTTNKINDISFIDPLNGIIVGDLNDVYKTTDGGTNWTLLTPAFPETNTSFAVNMIDADNIFLCGGNKRIMKSVNGGSNWSNIYNTNGNYWRGLLFMTATMGYVVGQGGKILYTTTGGSTFTVQSTTVTDDLNDIILAPDNSIFIAGNNGVILKKAATPTTPVADFTTFINLLAVTFTDASTNNPTSWSWNFADGQTSTLQNPSHTFTASGTYNVCLTATNLGGSNTKCKDVVVSNVIKPIADFDFTTNLRDVTFKDKSINTPNTWLWEFGDGQTATQQNLNHTYIADGNYTVCLTSSNSAGTDSICKKVLIQISSLEKLSHSFDPKFEIYPNPVNSTFHLKSFPESQNISKPTYFFQIITITGQVVFEKILNHSEFNNNYEDIEISNLTSGIYILEYRNTDHIYRQKLVVQ